jgi:hypothetical protein
MCALVLLFMYLENFRNFILENKHSLNQRFAQKLCYLPVSIKQSIINSRIDITHGETSWSVSTLQGLRTLSCPDHSVNFNPSFAVWKVRFYDRNISHQLGHTVVQRGRSCLLIGAATGVSAPISSPQGGSRDKVTAHGRWDQEWMKAVSGW